MAEPTVSSATGPTAGAAPVTQSVADQNAGAAIPVLEIASGIALAVGLAFGGSMIMTSQLSTAMRDTTATYKLLGSTITTTTAGAGTVPAYDLVAGKVTSVTTVGGGTARVFVAADYPGLANALAWLYDEAAKAPAATAPANGGSAAPVATGVPDAVVTAAQAADPVTAAPTADPASAVIAALVKTPWYKTYLAATVTFGASTLGVLFTPTNLVSPYRYVDVEVLRSTVPTDVAKAYESEPVRNQTMWQTGTAFAVIAPILGAVAVAAVYSTSAKASRQSTAYRRGAGQG